MTPMEREATILKLVEQALAACWRQYEAGQQLAMHYPEASHVLSSPRKPDAIVILERLRHWMTELEPAAAREAQP